VGSPQRTDPDLSFIVAGSPKLAAVRFPIGLLSGAGEGI
jgi:hypothetical protein